MIGIVLLPNPLHLQIQEETFHDGVVPTVTLAAHAADQAMFGQQRLMLAACVLRIACHGLNEQLAAMPDFFE